MSGLFSSIFWYEKWRKLEIWYENRSWPAPSPSSRRGAALAARRGAHGKPDRAGALAWNRVCGAISSVFSAGRGFVALLKVFVARSHFIELTSNV